MQRAGSKSLQRSHSRSLQRHPSNASMSRKSERRPSYNLERKGERQPTSFKLWNVKFAGFQAAERLGRGTHGEVWLGVDDQTKSEVAIKLEKSETVGALEEEVTILSDLVDDGDTQGFTKMYYFGQEGPYTFLVMEKLGKSFREVMDLYPISEQAGVLLAQQVLQRIEYLHSKSFLHRDVKPENLMFGCGSKAHHVYLIDFSMAKRYWVQRSASKGCLPRPGGDGAYHVPYKMTFTFSGTAHYASVNCHKSRELSRRDDLESVAYVLLHMLNGSLPWSALKQREKASIAQAGKMKSTIPLRDICKGAPDAFEQFLAYARKLKFAERPDYKLMSDLFEECRSPATKDHIFDWVTDDPDFDAGKLEPLLPRPVLSQPDEHVPRRVERGTTRLQSLLNFALKTKQAMVSFSVQPTNNFERVVPE